MDTITNTILLLNKLTFTKYVNHIKLRLSFWLSIIIKKPIIWGQFESISIEPTNLCNLNCIECPTGTNSLTRKKGEIDINVVRNIIDENKKYLSYLIVYFQGEPFMANNIFEIINYANNNNIYTYTSTNGHYLSNINCEKIVNSKLNKLVISIDGTNQKTYEIYRKNGDFNKVINGIKTLVNTKNTLKSKTPFIEIQFLVFKHNQHQINNIKNLGKELNVNKVSLKTAQFYNKENYNLLTDIPKYSRYHKTGNELLIKKKTRNICWRMWHSSVITIDGNIIPCCFDKNAEYPYASINNKSLLQIRTSNKYKKFSNKIFNNRQDIDICRNCNE